MRGPGICIVAGCRGVLYFKFIDGSEIRYIFLLFLFHSDVDVRCAFVFVVCYIVNFGTLGGCHSNCCAEHKMKLILDDPGL